MSQLDLKIFKCLLSKIELNLNILLEIFKVLVRIHCLKWVQMRITPIEM